MRSLRIGSRPFQNASARQSVWRSSQMPARPSSFQRYARERAWSWGKKSHASPVGAVVLAHRAPGALAQVRAPVPPRRTPARHLAAAARVRRPCGQSLVPGAGVTRRNVAAPADTDALDAFRPSAMRRSRRRLRSRMARRRRPRRLRDGDGRRACAPAATTACSWSRRSRRSGGRCSASRRSIAVLVRGDARIRLAVHEWADGSVDPRGNVHLASFELEDGVPRWRWQLGDVVVERELAVVHGRPAVAIVHRVLAAPGPVRLELAAVGTWRDGHGERFAGDAPGVEHLSDGYVFEGAYRVAGPGFEPGGEWYRGCPLPRRGGAGAERPGGSLVRGHVRGRARAGRHARGAGLGGRSGRRAAAGHRGRRGGALPRPGARAAEREPWTRSALAARSRRRPVRRRRADRRRGLPVVRRLVPRHHDLLRGPVPRDTGARTRAGGSCCATRPR